MYLHHTEHCINCIIFRSEFLSPPRYCLPSQRQTLCPFLLLIPDFKELKILSSLSIKQSFSIVEKNVTGLFQKPVASNEFWIGSMER